MHTLWMKLAWQRPPDAIAAAHATVASCRTVVLSSGGALLLRLLLGHQPTSVSSSSHKIVAWCQSKMWLMVTGKASDKGLVFIEGTGPTYSTEMTFLESLLSGGGITLADLVVAASKLGLNPTLGFALVRSPRHHAVPQSAMDFFVFGNIAVAARYAQHYHGLKCLMVIDFDIHHGNGISDAFYDLPLNSPVLYPYFLLEATLALIRSMKSDRVTVKARDSTFLCPMAYATRCAFDEVFAPLAYQFKPDIILVLARSSKQRTYCY